MIFIHMLLPEHTGWGVFLLVLRWFVARLGVHAPHPSDRKPRVRASCRYPVGLAAPSVPAAREYMVLVCVVTRLGGSILESDSRCCVERCLDLRGGVVSSVCICLSCVLYSLG